MSPALESMQPLLYPEPPPAWYAAMLQPYGWLLPVIALACLLLLFHLLRKRRATAVRPAVNEPASQLAEALQQLEQLPRPGQDEQAGPWLQQLNLLLKRFCAVRYPDVASHRLSGREWLAFLDGRCPAAGLTHWMILVQGSYLPDCYLSQAQVEGLHTAVTRWMRAHV